MKKLLVLFIAVFAMFQVAQAENDGDNLLIKTKDGNTVAYSLTTRPVVTFAGSDLVLTSTDVEVKYPIANVEEITFVDASAINEIKGDKVAFAINGQVINAKGLANGELVQVYNIDGKAIAQASANAEGTVTVDISTLGKGVYVIKAGKMSYKILK